MRTVMLDTIHLAGDLLSSVDYVTTYSDSQKAVVNGKLERQGYKAQNITYPEHATKFVYVINDKGHRMVIDLDGYNRGILRGNI